MMNKENPKASAMILVVEDDADQVWLYSRILKRYRLVCVRTASAALEAIRTATPDLILLDNVLDDGELGLEFLAALKKEAFHVPIVMVSGTLDVAAQLKALQGAVSASYVIAKPVDVGELEATVEKALAECGTGEAIEVLRSLERLEKSGVEEPDRRFLERLTRQHEMLRRLRGSSLPANVSKLSRDFGVSRRTIARDLQELVQRGQLPREWLPETASVAGETPETE